ncbi:MAG: pilus assembly PilX family protein [Thermoanaerobaculum sp.]
MKNSRGAALVTVIMVLLILTVLAMALSLLMTQEDRTSGRQDVQKLALYAAEAGLRRGEVVLKDTKILAVNSLLGYQSNTLQAYQETPQPPQMPVSNDLSTWDAQHLGTYLLDQGTELANQELAMPLGQGKRAFYSVYIRDNPDDPTPNPETNGDTRVRLIAVGWVANSGDPAAPWRARGVAAVKILEEEVNWQGMATTESAQKLVDTGGTGSGQVTSWGGV